MRSQLDLVFNGIYDLMLLVDFNLVFEAHPKVRQKKLEKELK